MSVRIYLSMGFRSVLKGYSNMGTRYYIAVFRILEAQNILHYYNASLFYRSLCFERSIARGKNLTRTFFRTRKKRKTDNDFFHP